MRGVRGGGVGGRRGARQRASEPARRKNGTREKHATQKLTQRSAVFTRCVAMRSCDASTSAWSEFEREGVTDLLREWDAAEGPLECSPGDAPGSVDMGLICKKTRTRRIRAVASVIAAYQHGLVATPSGGAFGHYF